MFVVKQRFASLNGNACLPLNLQIQIERGSSESVRYCNSLRSCFTLMTKKECRREKRAGGGGTQKTLSLFLPCAPEFFSDTQLMSNSHKCNPLCCIMFLFTFQECGVVRGVLIHWLAVFILTTSLSVSLSFCHSYSFSPLLLYLQSNPLPPPPCPLTHFLLSKEEELGYLTPPVWASHLPIFLPVDHQPARVVMEGEIRRLTSPPSGFPSSPSQQHAWCCTVRTE